MPRCKEFHNLIDNGKKEYLQESQLHVIVSVGNAGISKKSNVPFSKIHLPYLNLEACSSEKV